MMSSPVSIFVNPIKTMVHGCCLKHAFKRKLCMVHRIFTLPHPSRQSRNALCVLNSALPQMTCSDYRSGCTLYYYRYGFGGWQTVFSSSLSRFRWCHFYSTASGLCTALSALIHSDIKSACWVPSKHQSSSVSVFFSWKSDAFIHRQYRLMHSLSTKEEFTLDNNSYKMYLNSLVEEYNRIAEYSLKGNISSIDHAQFLFLRNVTLAVNELENCYAELNDLRLLITGEVDDEMQAMAKKDMENILQKIHHLEAKIVYLIVGSEPADRNDIVLEVTAGIGGQEAMLFTAEIFDMYQGYADFKGWTFDVVDFDKSELGGVRKASALISGVDVYKHLKFEAGVHRVQRVPKTEKSGRLHTSTMTVAVLPQPSEIDITVNPKDLYIDTYRAGGAGGQHVNKTESAVRITHKPTGTIAECQQERSQIKNREIAMKILLSRIYQKQVEEQEQALQRKRKLQVGSGGRSEKIRTYSYSQDRITDHRGPRTLFNIADFLTGRDAMENLIHSMMDQSHKRVLQALVDEFVEGQLLKKP